MAFWDWVNNLSEPEQAAWGYRITLLCVFFSAQIAFRFLYQNPRLFTAMALFACMWMCVTGAYVRPKEPHLSDLITDIASFLEVYIGGLLLAEGMRRRGHESIGVSWLQTGALLLLLFIVWPKQIEFPESLINFLGKAGLSETEAKFLASCTLELAGFASVMVGVYYLIGPTVGLLLLGVVLGSYDAAALGRQFELWGHPCTHQLGVACPDRPMFYTLLFAIGKMGYTAALGCIVAYHGMPPYVKERGVVYWVMRFFYIPSFLLPGPAVSEKEVT
jgi:hypothetical protein